MGRYRPMDSDNSVVYIARKEQMMGKYISEDIRLVRETMDWDGSTWCAMTLTAVWSGLIGVVIFGIALYHIIGWSIAPNASAFMWIINQIGGGQ